MHVVGLRQALPSPGELRAVAFAQRARDGRLVRKILVERTDRRSGPKCHGSQRHRVVTRFGHDRRGRIEDDPDPLLGAGLTWDAAPDA